MKKRNKKYSGPKYVARNVISTFFGGMSGVHKDNLQELQVKNHHALAEFAKGSGDRYQWDMLMGAINIGNVMCEQGIGVEYRAEMRAARDAMEAIGLRAAKTGSFTAIPDEMEILNESMSIHDAQLENVRSGDVDKAAAEMQRRLRYRINSTSIARELAKEAA